MATKVLAPRMGEGVEHVTITKWLKSEGDSVKELELIVEVETDKVTTEIPSPADGSLLKIVVPANTEVEVDAVIAWVGQPGEELVETGAAAPTTPAQPEQPAAEASEEKPAQSVDPEAVTSKEKKESPGEHQPVRIKASPLVKNIAKELNLDLALVKGSGLEGTITKTDVENYLKASEKPAATPETTSAKSATFLPHTSLRRKIAERMVHAKQTAPHVLTVMEADLTQVIAHRKANKPSFAERGINLTLTAYFCKAIIQALQSVPLMNSTWMEDGIQLHNEVNLGLAVSLGDEGLIVPVIKNAGRLSLEGLAEAIQDLASRARDKKLKPEEVRDATFTITNHGTGGSLFALPVIPQPQAGILGTGTMKKRAIVVTDSSGQDAIAIKPMIYLSLVFDHRILDGEQADRFLAATVQNLERWETA